MAENLLDALFKLLGAAAIVTCRGCQQKNKLSPGKPAPRCGKCGLPLDRR